MNSLVESCRVFLKVYPWRSLIVTVPHRFWDVEPRGSRMPSDKCAKGFSQLPMLGMGKITPLMTESF